MVVPLPVYAASTPNIVPVISGHHTPIEAPEIGLAPMSPSIAELWLPVSVIAAHVRIAKRSAERRFTGSGPKGAVTVRFALPDVFTNVTGSVNVAVIAFVPVPTPVARPLFARPLTFIVATVISAEDQTTDAEVVSGRVLPSEKLPVAVNCWVRPLATVGFRGVTEIDWSAAAVTVRFVLPDTFANVTGSVNVAVITFVPSPTPVARPLFALPLAFMVATVISAEDQTTDADVVSGSDVPSEKLPVAVNCWVRPLATVGFGGVTEIDWSAAAVTVKFVIPDIVPNVAVIVVAPADTPVARPLLLTMATVEKMIPAGDDQITDEVISPEVPSEYVPVAMYCWVRPLAML